MNYKLLLIFQLNITDKKQLIIRQQPIQSCEKIGRPITGNSFSYSKKSTMQPEDIGKMTVGRY
jgi:hypothetical protein